MNAADKLLRETRTLLREDDVGLGAMKEQVSTLIQSLTNLEGHLQGQPELQDASKVINDIHKNLVAAENGLNSLNRYIGRRDAMAPKPGDELPPDQEEPLLNR